MNERELTVPTNEQIEKNATLALEHGYIARACWYPQMGGYEQPYPRTAREAEANRLMLRGGPTAAAYANHEAAQKLTVEEVQKAVEELRAKHSVRPVPKLPPFLPITFGLGED